MRKILWALAAMVAAAPAHAQIALEPGQAITLSLSNDADVRVTAMARTTAMPFDRAFLAKVDDAYKSQDNVWTARMNDAPAIAPDALELRFVVVDGKTTILVLSNGYLDGVTYRAAIYTHGKSSPTDVCLMMPHVRGYEYWPFAIDRIELSAFHRAPWKQGDPIPCA